MSTSASRSDNESQCLPDSYPLSDRESCRPNHNKPPSIPVFTPLSVPLSLAPSLPGTSPSRAASHLLSPFSASHSESTSEESDDFEDHEGFPSSSTSSSHAIRKNPFDFGRACEVPGGSPIFGTPIFSTAPTSLASSYEHIPVSLPISAPEWMKIFAKLFDDDSGATERFARTVQGDSVWISYLKDIEVLKEHNRLANMRNDPLTPVPNLSGHIMPPGYNHAITSLSQIREMALAELDCWLSHYGLTSARDELAGSTKRLTLASHVGIVALEGPNVPVGGPSSA